MGTLFMIKAIFREAYNWTLLTSPYCNKALLTPHLNKTLPWAVPSAIDLPKDDVDGPDDGDGVRQHMPL